VFLFALQFKRIKQEILIFCDWFWERKKKKGSVQQNDKTE